MVNEQDTHTWISFKFRELLFPTFVYCYRFTSMLQFSFAYSARQRLFLIFFIEILRWKLAHGCLKLILSRMPYVWPLCSPHYITSNGTTRHGTARHGTARHGTVDTTRCDTLRLCTLLTTLTKLHLTALHCTIIICTTPKYLNTTHHHPKNKETLQCINMLAWFFLKWFEKDSDLWFLLCLDFGQS